MTPRVDTTQYHFNPQAIPKVPFFSGDDQKGDVTYIEWRFEIRCLFNDPLITHSTLVQAIRRSLRGTARTILVSLGEHASEEDILSKLDALFGDVSSNGMLLQDFFNSYQKPEESVTSFGCRLENLLQLAVDHGHMPKDAKNDLLRHKFWTSLSSDKLKSQTRHKYDTITSYDALLREIRTVEKEMLVNAPSHSSTTKKVTQQPVVAESHSDLKSLYDQKLDSLEKKLDAKIEEKFSQILNRLDQMPSNTSPNNFQDNNRNYNNNRRYNNRRHNNNNNRYNNNRYNNNNRQHNNNRTQNSDKQEPFNM